MIQDLGLRIENPGPTTQSQDLRSVTYDLGFILHSVWKFRVQMTFVNWKYLINININININILKLLQVKNMRLLI